MKNKSIVLGCAAVLSLLGMQVWGVCPSMDITGDCYVDLADFAVFAGQWMTGDRGLIACWTMNDNTANKTVVDTSDHHLNGTAQQNTAALTQARGLMALAPRYTWRTRSVTESVQ